MPTLPTRTSLRKRHTTVPSANTSTVVSNPITSSTTSIACFAYGSNGTAQLQERCKNPALISHKAVIHDYCRFFTGNSTKWGGGGVASLAPLPNNLCKGSVVYLTEAELCLLDRFEGIPENSDPFIREYTQNRYSRRWVDVQVWHTDSEGTDDTTSTTSTTNQSVTIRAIAYIRNKTDWEGMPSNKYLAACYRNIFPFWPEVDRYGKLLVHSYDESEDSLLLRGEYIGQTEEISEDGTPMAKTFLGRLSSTMKYPSSSIELSLPATPYHVPTNQHAKTPLHCSIAVYAVDQISPVDGTYQILYRMYLWWEILDTQLVPFLDRARATGGCVILNNEEINAVEEQTPMPVVEIYNKLEEPLVMDRKFLNLLKIFS